MRKLISSVSVFFLSVAVTAQEGSPLLTHFRQNRDIENQNWAICQDKDKVMLFAGRKGVMVFDGADWTHVRIPTTPYVIKAHPGESKIYIGGGNNYGFIEKDNKGIYRFESFSGDSAGIGMITGIVFNDSLALFSGDRSVICYNLKTNRISKQFFTVEGEHFTGAFLKGENIYINVSGKGLHRIDADTLFPIVTGYMTAETEILFSLPFDDNRILLGFSNSRLSLFDGIKYYSYPVDDDGYIAANVLAEGIAIGDSLYAFSTLEGGAVVAERNTGRIRFIINNRNGLPDDEVFAIGSDATGGLWLSHNFGLTRADLKLPVRNFSCYPGLTGNLAASLMYNNELFVATSEGVFYLAGQKKYTEIEVLRKNESKIPVTDKQPEKGITSPLILPPAQQENTRKGIFNRIFGRKDNRGKTGSDASSKPLQATTDSVAISEIPGAVFRTEKIKQLKSVDYVYKKIAGINEKCRQLVATENGILAATNRGLFVIRDHKASSIVPERYINYISWVPEQGRYAVAASDGYFFTEASKSRWSVTVPDRYFSEPVYSVVYRNDVLWLGCDDKAFRIEQVKGKMIYRSYSVEAGFTQKYALDIINDTVFLFTENSVNYFDEAGDKFVSYKPVFYSETSVLRYPVSNVPLINPGTRWICPDLHKSIGQRNLSLLRLFDNVASVYCDGDKIWLVDGTDKLFGIDCNRIPAVQSGPDIIVKNVRDEKGTIFDVSDIVFDRGDNVINFDVVVPSYLNRNLTEYQYYIDKVMTEWSPWSDRTSYSRGIPKPGHYELMIRAKDLWGQAGEPVVIGFTMKAPFTRTTFFYMIIVFAAFGAILLLIFLRQRRLKEKNRILEDKVRERTAEIEAQKEEITSSIAYAARLQMAMLPVHGLFREAFSDYFVIFKPRDIVSGDFYWIGEDNANIYFTVADCTGHGVPGAFMSALGISILNEIILHNKNLEANTFLNLLREKIKAQLHQTGKDGEATDGIDISLCALKKNRELLQFSGAFNPLYIHTGGELKELRADRMPIGIHYGDETSFSNHEIRLKKGDVLYLLSDGLTDQFGGPDGSKFKKARLKKLLSEIHLMPLSDQQKLIELEFLKWKSSHEQVDDVTVVGVRI